jgi:hypothetical protein
MKRLRLVIIVLGIVILAIGLALFFLRRTAAPGEAPQAPAVNAPTGGLGTTSGTTGTITNVPVTPPPPPPTVSAEERAHAEAQTLATLFVERYGSYSNQSNFQNLEDLLPLMSDSFRAKTERDLEALRRDTPPPTEYVGVTTRVLSTAEREYDLPRGAAAFRASVQKSEVKGTAPPTITYPAIDVTLVREGGAWKVSSAVWQQ